MVLWNSTTLKLPTKVWLNTTKDSLWGTKYALKYLMAEEEQRLTTVNQAPALDVVIWVIGHENVLVILRQPIVATMRRY